MLRRFAVTAAVIAASTAAALASAPGALASRSTHGGELPAGDLVVTFSGFGGGAYRFHEPPLGAGSACRVADTTYSGTDAYHWIYRFALPPTGGSSDSPIALAAAGQLSATEQLLQCAGTAAVTSTCTQGLRAPLSANSGDLAYPGVTVALSGRSVTVGAVGELIPATPQPLCSGIGVLLPSPVEAFAQLQGSVSIPRAALAGTGDVTRRFTIAGSGLYAGVALSANCDSGSCDTATCANTATPGPGGPSSCSFDESYSGTIEVRVVR
jgi:hypothetical protein